MTLTPELREAEEAARRIVADAPYSEDGMRAMAALCDLSGYDEDGIRETYRGFIVARALLSLLSREEETWEEMKERCAKAVEHMQPCPFAKGQSNNLEPTDRCPVCGDLGTMDNDEPSKCQSAAAIIRSLPRVATSITDNH